MASNLVPPPPSHSATPSGITCPPFFLNLSDKFFCICLQIYHGDELALELYPNDRGNVPVFNCGPFQGNRSNINGSSTSNTNVNNNGNASSSETKLNNTNNVEPDQSSPKFPTSLPIPRKEIMRPMSVASNASSNPAVPSISLPTNNPLPITNNSLNNPTLEYYQQQWVKISHHPELSIRFFFTVNMGFDVKGLTFIHATSGNELHEILYRKFKEDPNIHRLPNVTLIGDISASSNVSVPEPIKIVGQNDQGLVLYSWDWNFLPLPDSEDDTNVCSFFEYNANENGFRILATFSFYCDGIPRFDDLINDIPHTTNTNGNHNHPNFSPSAEDVAGLQSRTPPVAGVQDANNFSISSPGHFSTLGESSINEIMEKSANQVKRIVNSIEDFDSEDGPLFRATLTAMEKKTANLKQNLKKIIKAVQNLIDKDKDWIQAQLSLIESFQGIPALAVAREYIQESSNRLLSGRETYLQQVQSLLLEPLKKLYENDVKNADSRKKEFDSESEDYYSFLSKYLGMKNFDKKRSAYDQKYMLKKRQFDLKRFDYFSFMQDLHGRKDQEILYHMSSYFEREANHYHGISSQLYELSPLLKNLCKQVEENTKSISHALKEREEKRRAIETRLGQVLLQQQQQQQSNNNAANNNNLTNDDENNNNLALDMSPNLLASSNNNNNNISSPLTVLPNNAISNANATNSANVIFSPNINGNNVVPSVLTPSTQQGGSGSLLYGSSANNNNNGNNTNVNNTASNNNRISGAFNLDISSILPHNNSLSNFGGVGAAGPGDTDESISNSAAAAAAASAAKFKGIRDLDYHDSEAQNHGRKKEGILYALKSSTGPTGSVWKKYWCVLSGGQIHEHVHWKENMKINNTIDLRFCTVREARGLDRRFCFEILSPYFNKRVYQATSQEEMTQWIYVICNAIESLLNGTSSKDNLTNNNNGNGNGASLPSPGGPLDDGTGNNLNSSSSLMKDGGDGFQPLTLVEELRSRDVSNNFCADCGAKNPDWCSINLSVIVCIECSGIHRSLGSHISKIRSLTLDTLSWTPEVVSSLRTNQESNAIYEARFPQPPFTANGKPQPSDRRDVKQRFILAKYVDKLFWAAVATTKSPGSGGDSSLSTLRASSSSQLLALDNPLEDQQQQQQTQSNSRLSESNPNTNNANK